jgi:predicted MFS family arabinose efflux permease
MQANLRQPADMKADNGYPTDAKPVTRMGEWAAGWRTLTAGFFAVGVGWNFANIAASIFIKPMQAEFGWTRTELSFGPLAGLLVALLLPLTGLLLDRWGSRRVAITGLVAIAAGFALFARMPVNHAIFVIYTIYLGIAGAISNSVVMGRGVAPWFPQNLGTAIGIMMTGSSVSVAIAVPLLAWVIAHFGWRSGFVVLTAATLAVGLPLVLLWFREPTAPLQGGRNVSQQRDSMGAIAATTQFWQLTIACAVAALPIGGFIGHLMTLLSDRGLSVGAAAGVGSLFAISVGVGRIANGVALDRLYPPLVVACTLLLAAAGALLLYVSNLPTAAGAEIAVPIALLGLAQGAEGDYIMFFSMRLFGLRNLSRVLSIQSMAIGVGMASGGLAFARVFDIFGSYQPAILGSALLYTVSAVVFGTIRMKRQWHDPQ